MARKDTVTVKGMDKLAKKLHELPEAVRDGARKAVKDETHELAEDMRRNAPRGNPPTEPVTLVEGIQEEITADGLGGTAAATARHSPFVEHGTSDTPAQPFAQPAAERSRRRFRGRLEQEIGGSLKELTK